MAKKVTGYIKLQINAGAANPAPPVGPALGQRGLNIEEHCKSFNEKTKDTVGFNVPVIVKVYSDEMLCFLTKHPPDSALLTKGA